MRVQHPAGSRATVSVVVAERLCHSCGVCAGICPHSAISFDQSARPLVADAHCVQCGLCLRICSGWQGQIRPDALRQEQYCLAASQDDSLRRRSSSGGLVTELLCYLLEQGTIQRALVTVADPVRPERPRTILATSKEQLRESCQSRYCLFPWGETVAELLAAEGPFAVVGTSCQLASFVNCLEVFPRLRHNLRFLVGICCESNIEPQATDYLLRHRGVATEELAALSYRSGSWPGVMAARMKDGGEVLLSNRNRLEGAINYLKLLYGRSRCNFCSDILCEVADMVVGDPWSRQGDGRLTFRGSPGYSAALVRNGELMAILKEMAGQGRIHLRAERDTRQYLAVQLGQRQHLEARVRRELAQAVRSQQPFLYPLAEAVANKPGLRRGERLQQRLVLLCRREPLRSLLLRLFFSPLGDLLTRFNVLRRQYAARGRRAAANNGS